MQSSESQSAQRGGANAPAGAGIGTGLQLPRPVPLGSRILKRQLDIARDPSEGLSSRLGMGSRRGRVMPAVDVARRLFAMHGRRWWREWDRDVLTTHHPPRRFTGHSPQPQSHIHPPPRADFP
jgi:hypothetical protein